LKVAGLLPKHITEPVIAISKQRRRCRFKRSRVVMDSRIELWVPKILRQPFNHKASGYWKGNRRGPNRDFHNILCCGLR